MNLAWLVGGHFDRCEPSDRVPPLTDSVARGEVKRVCDILGRKTSANALIERCVAVATPRILLRRHHDRDGKSIRNTPFAKPIRPPHVLVGAVPEVLSAKNLVVGADP